MNVSRLQIGIILVGVGFMVAVCAYSFRFGSSQPTSLASPTLQVLGHSNVSGTDDDSVVDHLSSETPAVEEESRVSARALPPIKELKPADLRAMEKAEWEKEFAGLERTALLKALGDLNHELEGLTSEPIQNEFDAGRYQVVGHGKKYSFDNETWDHAQIGAVRFPADTDEIRKVVLQESQYAELYALKRKTLWLKQQAQLPERQD
jgi:hypothetical protein